MLQPDATALISVLPIEDDFSQFDASKLWVEGKGVKLTRDAAYED